MVRRRLARRAVLAGLATLAVVAPVASAAPIDNPGNFTATFTGGHLKVIDSLVSLDFSQAHPVALSGTIDKDGNIDVPSAGLTFPSSSGSFLGIPVTVQLVSQGVTGTLDPVSGDVKLTLKGYVDLHAGPTADGEADCQLGSPAGPLSIELDASAPYSATDGTLTLVNNTFGLLGGSCPSGTGDLLTEFEQIIALPTLGGGHNELQLVGAITPILKPGTEEQAPPPPTDTGQPPTTPTPTTPTTPSNQGQPPTVTPPPTKAPPAKKCVVPKLTGKSLSAAKKALKKANCALGKVTKKKSSKKKDTVLKQSVKAGAQKTKGTKVALTVAKR